MLRWLFTIVTIATSGVLAAGEDIVSYNGYQPFPEAPPFTVLTTELTPKFKDCARCHEPEDNDPEIRKLKTRHTREIDHGGNRFWCMTCHGGENLEHLRTARNERIDFEQSYLICGSCHADRQRDWYFGGHGKRISGWQGDRVIQACTICHDPHKPAKQPREPLPPPPVRVGLERQDHHRPEPLETWRR